MKKPSHFLASVFLAGAIVLSSCAPAAAPTAAPKPTEAPKPVAAATTAPPPAPTTAPATTIAPAKPVEAVKPAEVAKPVEAAKPTTAPAVSSAPVAAPAASAQTGGLGSPVDGLDLKAPVEITFWHTQTGPLADALKKIVDDFNKKNPNVKVKAEYGGNYTQLYQKAMASLQGGGLPDIAVAYESMVADYMKANAIVALEDYVNSSKYGLSKADLDDIFPFAISRNRFPQFQNKLLSFPFTTSNLNMYFNADMLKLVGQNGPPETWEDFYTVCKAIKDKLSKPCYAASVDASTIHGMIYSFGGTLLDSTNTKTLYDQKPTIDAMELLERMTKEGMVYQIKPTSFDDQNDLATEKVAFIIRSSTTRTFLDGLIKDKFKWGMSIIPQSKDNKEKATTLFGANVTIFKSTPERQLASWMFLKYFASTEVTSEWGAVGGYTPVRRTGATVDPYKSYLAKEPVINRVALDNMQFSRPEPNLLGYQDIRPVLEDAQTAVLAGKMTGQQAAKKMKEESDKILADKRS